MFGKLKGRSAAELRVRGWQAAGALFERLVPPRGYPVLPAAGPMALPAPGLGDGGTWARAIAERWPEHAEALVARAERVLSGRYDLLGFDGLEAGASPDWHRDPDSGRRADSHAHWSAIPFLDLAAVGDHKVTWELNRQQYLVTLAQAWRVTGDARYAAHVARVLASWLDANPPARGINWASALEVAFRSVAWLWTLALLEGAPELDAALRGRVVGALAWGGRHLARNLSIYFSPNTHLTGEALGLLYLGVACPGLPGAAGWRELGTRVLLAEATRQIRPDGTYFEQTTWYQHYTVEFYLHALWLWEAGGTPVPNAVRTRAERAAEVLHAVLRPDGSLPHLGDDDGGRTLVLDGRRPGDFRDTLALAAVRFGRADFAAAAGPLPPSAAWLLGAEGVVRYEALRSAPVDIQAGAASAFRLFADGGLAVLRDGWHAEASVCTVDAGRHGELTSGHSHADALALDLTLRGRPLLSDPGTARYLGPLRDAFRHAAAHNTVTIDGASAAEPDGPFRWRTLAHAEVRTWVATHDLACVEAEVRGWADRPAPARHARVVLLRPDAYWLVIDQVDAGAPACVAVHWQAAPGLRSTLASDGSAWTLADALTGAPLATLMVAAAPGAAAASADESDGAVSRAYGAVQTAPHVTWTVDGQSAVALAALLAPHDASDAGAAAPWTIHADGAGWSARGPHGVFDAVRVDAAWEAADGALSVAGRLVWVRTSAAGHPTEFLVLGPTTVAIDGEAVQAARGWVVGTRAPDGSWSTIGGPS